MTDLGTVSNTTNDGSGLVPLDTSPVVFIFKVTNTKEGQTNFLVQASIIIVGSLYFIMKSETQIRTQYHGISPCFFLSAWSARGYQF